MKTLSELKLAIDGKYCPNCHQDNMKVSHTFIDQTSANDEGEYYMVWACTCDSNYKTKHKL